MTIKQNHRSGISKNSSFNGGDGWDSPTEDTCTKKIEALEERLHLQDLISNLSAIFVNLPANKVDKQIEKGLKSIVEFLDIDRSGFGEYSEDLKEYRTTHSYSVPGIEPSPKGTVADVFPWYSRKLLNGEVVVVEDTADLPDEAAEEKEYCRQTGLKSQLTIPVSIGGNLVCALGFGAFRAYRDWSKEVIELLKRAAEIFAQAVYRKRADQLIQDHLANLKIQYKFEKLISQLSARFVNIVPADVDKQISKGLRSVAEFLNVDRSNLFKLSEDNKELIATHLYTGKGIEEIKRVAVNKQFPWATAQVLLGGSICFSTTEDLQVDATIDRRSFKKLGLKSNVTTPLFVEGKVKYALTAGMIRKERIWPEEIVPRLKLIGEIFVNAILRKEYIELLHKEGDKLKCALNDNAILTEQLKQDNKYLREEIKTTFNFENFIGKSGGLKYIFQKINQVASTDVTVLIQGETGTGKELVARALHLFSSRKNRSLIKVDCSSLPATMIESELFGHEKGAYTGAHARRIGRFELADNATIFLDEIGEIPIELQAKLLRVLENGEFERLGSSKTIKVDVRILTATNRRLKEEVDKGRFREDLFYRLNVFPLTIPPLRERKEDIPILVDSFVKRFSKKVGKKTMTIPDQVLSKLRDYSWPGNVRELQNIIERAVITTSGSIIKSIDCMVDRALSAPHMTLEANEHKFLREILEETYWRIEGKNGAAEILGINSGTLRSRMKKLGIKRPQLKNKT